MPDEESALHMRVASVVLVKVPNEESALHIAVSRLLNFRFIR